MKKIILILCVLLFLYGLTRWFTCGDFKPEYHFSPYSLKLISDDYIHNDTGLPFCLIRFYHNKIALSATLIYSAYLKYWNIQFLTGLFLFTGAMGMLFALWYCLTRNYFPRFIKILVTLMIIFPLAEITVQPGLNFPFKIIIFTFPYQLFSLFGMSKLVDSGNKFHVYLSSAILIFLSVWWLTAFPNDNTNFCR